MGHILILGEYELIVYQQLHSDHIRLYGNSLILVRFIRKKIFLFFYRVEMQRARRDYETLSNSRFSTVSSVRRESDRLCIPKCLNLSMITVIYDTQDYCQ